MINALFVLVVVAISSHGGQVIDLGNAKASAETAAASRSTSAKPEETNVKVGDPIAKVQEASVKVVLELISGERVDGMLQGATTSEVRISVAGQLLTMPIATVRVVYMGDAPKQSASAAQSSEQIKAVECLTLLQGLDSVVTSGINYVQYSQRMLDAKVKVDQYLAEAKDQALRKAIGEAMQYYEWAANAWSAKISSNSPHLNTPLGRAIRTVIADQCPSVKAFVDDNDKEVSMPSFRTRPRTEESKDYSAMRHIGPQPFWPCANAKLSEVRTLAAR
jgi:hypothetical protein